MSNKGIPSIEVVNELEIVKQRNLQVDGSMTGRRGGIIKLYGDGAYYALKIVDSDAPCDFPDLAVERSVSIRREAEILQKLDDFTGNIYVADGQDRSQTWLLTKWIDGENAMVVSKSIKAVGDISSMKENMLKLFLKIMQKVSELHDLDYIHGDLQPVHIIVGRHGEIHLTDFELARHKLDTHMPYAGGLVHYNSPEVAKEMLVKSKKIPIDVISEVYSLASVLFILYTGKPSTFYGSYAYKSIPLEQKLMDIVGGKKSTFAQTQAEPFLEMEKVLSWCLETEREERCTALPYAIKELEKIIV